MHVTRRRTSALLAVAVSMVTASLLPASAQRTGIYSLCEQPRYVAGLGMACPSANGTYAIMLDDGLVRYSHGPDPLSPVFGAGAKEFGETLRNPKCVRNPRNEFHHKMLYTYAQDDTNRYSQRLSEMRLMVRMMNGFLYDESKQFGRPMEYRVACTSTGEVSVDTVRLAISRNRSELLVGAQDYVNIVNEVRRAGYSNPFAKYWIYFEGKQPSFPGIAGIASGAIGDDRPSANNWNNYGPGYGVFYGLQGESGAEVMMHEDAHTMGAVSANAPNTSRGFHCNDGQDVMCYKDGGAASDAFSNSVCRRKAFDCNYNDYFNPKPKAGSFLATHWNLGHPRHRFFQGCIYQTAQVTGAGGPEAGATIEAQSRDVGGLLIERFSIPSACRGDQYALNGVFSPQPAQADGAVGLLPHGQLPFGIHSGEYIIPTTPTFDGLLNDPVAPDFDICFYKGSTLIRCDTAVGPDEGTIPGTATKAVVGAKASVTGVYVFNAI